MLIHVDVTELDIHSGHPSDSMRCPIAIALRRAVGREVVDVYGTYCEVRGRRADLPVPARVFVSRYDDGDPVGPLTFELDIPEEVCP